MGANLTVQTSDRRRRWLKTLGVTAAAFVLFKLLFSFVFSDMGIFTFVDLHRARHELRREIADLRQRNAKLAGQVQALRSDPVYIEALAREQLGMVRPGEQVFRLVPSEKGAAPALPGRQAGPEHD
ncbi:MAG: septum formation initiator family protein [Nitrospirota bacterium]